MLRFCISLILAAAIFHSGTGQPKVCPEMCITENEGAEVAPQKLCEGPVFGLCEAQECTDQKGRAGFGCRLPAGYMVIYPSHR